MKRLLATVLLAMTPAVVSATTLSGLVVVASNPQGGDLGFGGGIWSTSTENWWKLWVSQGDFGGPFINGPTEAQASINLPLTPGTHTFTLQNAGDYIAGADHFAINIFFNGNNTAPSISAYTPLHRSGAIPDFFVNQSNITSGLDLDRPRPSGTFTFSDATNTVTLTDFWWSRSPDFTQDRVGPLSATPDGLSEFVGQITLNVTPVPEPATIILLVLGCLVCLLAKRRQHRLLRVVGHQTEAGVHLLNAGLRVTL